MARTLARTPYLVSMTLALAASAGSLSAQRVEIKRTSRASASDSLEMQVRRLQRAADSLANLFYDEDLSAAERRRVGLELDRTIAMYQLQNLRMQQPSAEDRARSLVRVQVGPITSATAESNMANALTESIAREATPRGWIGMLVTGAATEQRVERGELILHYFSYPVVASVDPSSPAQRAGIAPNDTLIAYNGRDVRDSDISVTRLLQPNNKVVVRIRREGKARDFPVVVATAPSRIRQRRDDEIRDAQQAWIPRGVPSAPVFRGVPNAPVFPRTAPPPPMGIASAPRVPTEVRTMTPMPSLPMAFSLTYASGAVAGAQMVTVTEGLGKTLGIQSGVLVTFAPAGSLAAESGLRDGDVIVKVAGQTVRNINELRELIGQAVENGDRSMELETVRERRTLKVMLRR
jgi:C-terminal processing protease CtpA/Prc